jgi:hypothetical protein
VAYTNKKCLGGTNMEYYPPLEKEVNILAENGIETFESCEGGEGHSYPEPTGDILDGEPIGPPPVK